MNYQNNKYDPNSFEAKVSFYIVIGLVFPIVLVLLSTFGIVSSQPEDLQPGAKVVRGWVFDRMRDSNRSRY